MKQLVPANIRKLMRSSVQAIGKMSDPDYRFSIRGKFMRNLHQTTGYTRADRYPNSFANAATILSTRSDLRLLSFGCATGEEVLSLRKTFPESSIIGAEINARRLKLCRERIIDPKITFIESTDQKISDSAPYDAIFAMAVLQRTPHVVERKGITNIANLYPFFKFEQQLEKFDENLQPGGIIVLQNTQYRFCDSSISERYTVHKCLREGPELPSFDRNGDLLADQMYDEFIFIKNA